MSLSSINLISALGLDPLPEDEKDELLQSIVKVAQEKALYRLMQMLDSSERDELNRLVDQHTADSQEVADFLAQNIPNIEDVFLEELLAMKQLILQRVSAAVAE